MKLYLTSYLLLADNQYFLSMLLGLIKQFTQSLHWAFCHVLLNPPFPQYDPVALSDPLNIRCEFVVEKNKITQSLQFRLVSWSQLIMVIVRVHMANWWSCQTAACHEWASRWAFCPPGAWRRAERWGWLAQPSEQANAVGAVRSAGAARGTACARTQSGPPELFPAGFPHELGLSAHTHLNTKNTRYSVMKLDFL